MVTALLTAAITRSVRTSSDAFALEIVAERALLAAESGAELALNRAFVSNSCSASTWDLDAFGLASCNVSTTCRSENRGPVTTI